MAKKPKKITAKSQTAAARRLASVIAKNGSGPATAKAYAKWCKDEAKLRKAPKPPKAKGAKS